LGANVFKSLEGVDGVTTRDAAYSGFDEIAFNTGAALDDGTPIGDGHPALKDKNVRLAIASAIDRKGLVDRVLNGRATPGTTIIPTIYQDLHLQPATEQAYDPTVADRTLDAAGYAKGPDGI